MDHPSEAELFESLHVADADGAVAKHLRICTGCAARMVRLEEAVRRARVEAEARIASKPDGYWSRQREEIRRRIESEEPSGRSPAMQRWAIAGSLLVLLVTGGVFLTERQRVPPVAATQTAVQAQPIVDPIPLPTADPWATEQLGAWEEAVAWESWLEHDHSPAGGA